MKKTEFLPILNPNMPYPLKINLICILPTLIMAIMLIIYFQGEKEISFFFISYRGDHPDLTRAFQIFTDWGNGLFYGLYVVFIIIGLQTKNRALVWFAAGCLLAHLFIVATLNPFVKSAVGRPRPMAGGGPFVHFAFNTVNVSFPSGHTTAMVGLIVPLAQRWARRWRTVVLLGLIPAAMAFSRIYLSMHYPTDLIGGVVMGSLTAFAAWKLSAYLMKYRPDSEQPVSEPDLPR